MNRKKWTVITLGLCGFAFAQARAQDAVPETKPMISVNLPSGANAAFYGFIMANAVYNNRRPNFIDLPTQATSDSGSGPGESTFNMTARQTRLGLKLSAPAWEGAKVTGVMELDFWGLRASNSASNDVLQSGPRLRMAYIRMEQGHWAMVAGQDWITALSPLNPTSLPHQVIPALHNAGNLWNRIPQIRTEFTQPLFNVKLALVRPFSSDETGRVVTVAGTNVNAVNQTDQPGSGELSRMPMLQFQTEATPQILGRAWKVGASASYMKQSYKNPVLGASSISDDIESWTTHVHAVLPVFSRFKIQGEGFYGKANSSFQGLAGVRADGANALRAVITRGGWVEGSAKVHAKASINAGAGTEMTDDTGVAAGTTVQNTTAFANVTVDLTSYLACAFEYDNIVTSFKSAPGGQAGHFNLALQLKF